MEYTLFQGNRECFLVVLEATYTKPEVLSVVAQDRALVAVVQVHVVGAAATALARRPEIGVEAGMAQALSQSAQKWPSMLGRFTRLMGNVEIAIVVSVARRESGEAVGPT